ncbi:MAG: hypothetical protein R2741_11400 [Methanolobus sp.]
MPEKITDEYYGDFNEIKNNLNQCDDAINALTLMPICFHVQLLMFDTRAGCVKPLW